MTAALDVVRAIFDQCTPEEALTDDEALTLVREIAARHNLDLISIDSTTIGEQVDAEIDSYPADMQKSLSSVRGSLIENISQDGPLATELQNAVTVRMRSAAYRTLAMPGSYDHHLRTGVMLWSADGKICSADTWTMSISSAIDWAARQCGRTLPEIYATDDDKFELGDIEDDATEPTALLWGDDPVMSFQVHLLDDNKTPDQRIVTTFTPDDFDELVSRPEGKR